MPQRLTRRGIVAGAAALPVSALLCGVPSVQAALRSRPKAGINLAGAEFGRVPGVFGTDYSYPGPRHLDYFASLGLSLVRVPFRWERLQPVLHGALDAIELERLAGFVAAARARNFTVVLDPHNYAKRFIADDGWTQDHVIGSEAVSQSAFADFWRRLAHRYSEDQEIWFGLMNEPNDISVGSWLAAANAAIAAIRAEGAANLILVPGVNWSGAHSWASSGNEAMAGLVDPGNAFAFEVHQYFDADSSGTSADAVSETIGSERIAAFEAWARRHGYRAVLGEFGIADNTASLNAGRDLLKAVNRSADIWIGWAAWAAGPGWPDDSIFLLEPRADGHMRPQARVLLEAATAP